jgi:NADPH-dependent curcumin reductase CurA
MWNIMYRQTKIQGFLVDFHEGKYRDEFYATIPKLVKEGKLKHKEHLIKGLELAGHVLRDQQTGANEGKSVIVVAEN